jgi:hypothetical protein
MLLHVAAFTAALIMTYLCCHPVLMFVRRGWFIKKQEVVNSLSEAAKKTYIEAFLKKKTSKPTADFERIYEERYGRYRLVVPSILLALVLLLLTLLITERAVAAIVAANPFLKSTSALPNPLVLPLTSVAAIVGAYTWVASALISAAVSYNLPLSLILSSTLRLVVAVPLGYAVASLAAPQIAPFIAFAIGAFPLSATQVALQKLLAKQINFELVSDTGSDQVTRLSGIDPAVADRLAECGITTIPQLAYSDPVQVSMGSNLVFNFVLDLVGQALAWIYFGPKLDVLRPLGLRGAVEVRSLLEDMDSDDAPKSQECAKSTFSAAAKALGIEPAAAFRSVCEEIANDPYTLFVWEVWDDSGVVLTEADERADRDEDHGDGAEGIYQ